MLLPQLLDPDVRREELSLRNVIIETFHGDPRSRTKEKRTHAHFRTIPCWQEQEVEAAGA
jgi:hypothetical protein